MPTGTSCQSNDERRPFDIFGFKRLYKILDSLFVILVFIQGTQEGCLVKILLYFLLKKYAKTPKNNPESIIIVPITGSILDAL